MTPMNDTDHTTPDDSMTETPDSETVVEEVIETVSEPVSPKPVKRGVGLPTVLFFSLLSAGGGALGGAWLAGSHLVPGLNANAGAAETAVTVVQKKADDVAADVQLLSERLADQQKALTDDMNTLRREVAVTATPALPDSWEDRFKALEAKPYVSPDGIITDPTITDRLDVLSEENAKLKEALTVLAEAVDPDALDQRLKALESQETQAVSSDEPALKALKERLEVLENRSAPEIPQLDLTPVTDRLKALERRAERQTEQMQTLRDEVPMPAFPKDAVIKAISEAETEAKPKGWLGSALSKHIQLADSQAVQSVNAITKLIAEEDISAAVTAVEALPAPGRHAAADWLTAAQDRGY